MSLEANPSKRSPPVRFWHDPLSWLFVFAAVGPFVAGVFLGLEMQHKAQPTLASALKGTSLIVTGSTLLVCFMSSSERPLLAGVRRFFATFVVPNSRLTLFIGAVSLLCVGTWYLSIGLFR